MFIVVIAPWFSSETLALYKPLTYLLTFAMNQTAVDSSSCLRRLAYTGAPKTRQWKTREWELIVACSSWRQWATPWALTQRHCVRLPTAAAAATRTKRTKRHQRQRQSHQNRQRQLQQPLTTAARCVWWHHARVSHSYRVDTLASARVAHCALLILIPAVRFAVRLHAWWCAFFS